MKTAKIIIAAALLVCSCSHAYAQNDGRRPPNRRPRQEEQQELTEEQKAAVLQILSNYDPAALTADQAKAIHEAFRDAGVRGGPAMADTLIEAGFDPDTLRDLAPPPDRNERGEPRRPGRDDESAETSQRQRKERGASDSGRYSVAQAISDRAQLHTIAFDALAFLTSGGMGDCTFLPPGKVCDYFGFQYMRDVDVNELGHNTSFVPRVANNVLYVLTPAQRNRLIELAEAQAPLLEELALARFPVIDAFWQALQGGEAPEQAAIENAVGDIFELDGQLAYQRAQVLGAIVASLDSRQKAYLQQMVFNDSSTWPEKRDQVDKRSLSHDVHVAVMTYASELFSWYAGSVEADTYFCPERHGTYFGAFYMKDLPAMGNRNYSISTSLTGNSGEQFLRILNPGQRAEITGLVDLQRNALEEIVTTRRAISNALRQFMEKESVNQDQVLTLARRYGELDGRIAYLYATRFIGVDETLTEAQRQQLFELRGTDAPPCTGAYLYSEPIAMP